MNLREVDLKVGLDIEVDLHDPAPHSVQPSLLANVFEESSIRIDCAAGNSRSDDEMASSSISWTFTPNQGDASVDPASRDDMTVKHHSKTRSRLTIPKFSSEHDGRYECSIESGRVDANNKRSARRAMLVHYVPRLDFNPSSTDDVLCYPFLEQNTKFCNGNGFCLMNRVEHKAKHCSCFPGWESGNAGPCSVRTHQPPVAADTTSSLVGGLIGLGVLSLAMLLLVVRLSIVYRNKRVARSFSRSYKALRRSIRVQQSGGKHNRTESELLDNDRDQLTMPHYCWQCGVSLAYGKQMSLPAASEVRLQMPALPEASQPLGDGGVDCVDGVGSTAAQQAAADLYRCASSPGGTPGLIFPCYDPNCTECEHDVRLYAFSSDVERELRNRSYETAASRLAHSASSGSDYPKQLRLPRRRTDRPLLHSMSDETTSPTRKHHLPTALVRAKNERPRLYGQSDSPRRTMDGGGGSRRDRNLSISEPPSPRMGIKRAAFHQHRSEAVEVTTPTTAPPVVDSEYLNC